MAINFATRMKKAWNAFLDRDSPQDTFSYQTETLNYGSSNRPDRRRNSRSVERTFGASVFNRLALDCTSVSIRHVLTDENGRYKEDIDSGLNRCFTIESNRDQGPKAFRQDVYASMFDEGAIAIVPTSASENIRYAEQGMFDIYEMRVGKITEWFPYDVRVKIYNDKKGYEDEIVLPKRNVAIVENPFYSVMNEPNSNTRRLLRKLAILDAIDEQSGSGKLDLLVQLPFAVKGTLKQQQAEDRRKAIEEQLLNSKYGIAYIDSTEHVTQLNRPVDNNIMSQVEYLTNTAYSELGVDISILNETANEGTMSNYMNRIVEPPVSAVVEAMNRAFLSEEARKKGERVMFFNDPFKLVSASAMGDLADKYTRNEIMSTNEVRQKIGMKPVDDPMADELRNKNLNANPEQMFPTTDEGGESSEYEQTEEL